MEKQDRNTLFIIETISMDKVKEEDLRLDHEVCKLKYKAWKDSTFEDYLDWCKGMYKSPFKFSTEDFAYFKDIESARKSVLSNQADMNDGGAYKYAAIVEIPFGASYSRYMYIQSYELFKYDNEIDTYVPIDLNIEDDEEITALKNKFIR